MTVCFCRKIIEYDAHVDILKTNDDENKVMMEDDLQTKGLPLNFFWNGFGQIAAYIR
jgi:hypothetical protein